MTHETISSRDLRAGLSEVLDSAKHGDATTVTRNGKPVAAVVPIDVLRDYQARIEADLHRYVDDNPSDDPNSLAAIITETLDRTE